MFFYVRLLFKIKHEFAVQSKTDVLKCFYHNTIKIFS